MSRRKKSMADLSFNSYLESLADTQEPKTSFVCEDDNPKNKGEFSKRNENFFVIFHH